MKKSLITALSLLSVLATLPSQASPKMPQFKGTWIVETQGSIVTRAEQPGKTTHWEANQRSLKAEATITEQSERTVSGVFKSARYTEQFICVIGNKNDELYCADEDGFYDLKLVDPNTMTVIYRHVKPTDTLAAIGTWKRKK